MIFGLLGSIIVILFVAAVFIFWIMMLLDAITNPRLGLMMRLIWVSIVLFGHIIGALIYFFVGKNAGAMVVKNR